MRLAEELKAFGVAATPVEFEEGLADVLAEMYPDWTADTLLIYWRPARDYCTAVARRFALPQNGVADDMILRRLINLRKRASDRLHEAPAAPRPRLKKVLAVMGIEVEEGAFREAIRTLFLDMHGSWSVDAFLAHWRDAAHFCALAAHRLGIDRNPATDAIILGTLLNLRRRGGQVGRTVTRTAP